MFSAGHKRLFSRLLPLSRAQSARLFLVGGAVRDLLTRAPARDSDVDVTVEGDGIRFAEAAAKELGGKLTCFEAFGTAKITGLEEFGAITELDCASTRTEVYETPGALPRVTKAPLDKDLARRDFSINAMAIAVEEALRIANLSTLPHDSVIDPFKGIADLKQRTIRILHEGSFLDDPTRLFRATRYLTRLEGSWDPVTLEKAREAVASGALQTISTHRIGNEIGKILAEQQPGLCFEELNDLGALKQPQVLPKLNLTAITCFKTHSLEWGQASPEEWSEIGWQILYHFLPGESREAIFRGFGFGKHFFKRYAAATKPNSNQGSMLQQILARSIKI